MSNAGEFLIEDLPVGLYTVVASSNGFQTVKIDNVPVSAGTIYTLPCEHPENKPRQPLKSPQASWGWIRRLLLLPRFFPPWPCRTFLLMAVTIRNSSRSRPDMPGITVSGAEDMLPSTAPVPPRSTGSSKGPTTMTCSGISRLPTSVAHRASPLRLFPWQAIYGSLLCRQLRSRDRAQRRRHVNLVIKSGTNQFHGSGFYYNRNEFFAANTPFAPAGTKKSYLRNINSGGSLGGPIIKDKTFFFAAYEYQGFGIANVTSATEPSAAYQAAGESVLSFDGVPVNPVSINLLNNLWPADALTGPAQPSNYFNNAIARGFSDNGIIKIDQNINSKNSFSAKGYFGYGHAESPLSLDPFALLELWSAAKSELFRDL